MVGWGVRFVLYSLLQYPNVLSVVVFYSNFFVLELSGIACVCWAAFSHKTPDGWGSGCGGGCGFDAS